MKLSDWENILNGIPSVNSLQTGPIIPKAFFHGFLAHEVSTKHGIAFTKSPSSGNTMTLTHFEKIFFTVFDCYMVNENHAIVI